MNKTQKALLIAGIALVVGLIILGAVAVWAGGSALRLLFNHDWEQDWQQLRQQNGHTRTVQVQEQPLEAGFSSLRLENTLHQVIVLRGDSDKASLSYQAWPEESYDVLLESDGTLVVRGSYDQPGFKLSDLTRLADLDDWDRCQLELTLPQDWQGDISISSPIGDLELKGLDCGRLDLELSCGDLQLQDCRCGALNAKVSLGNLELEQVRVNQARLDLACGDLDLEQLDANNLEIKCAMGDVSGDLVGSRADYQVRLSRVLGDCSLLEGGAGPRQLALEVDLGDVDLDFEQR